MTKAKTKADKECVYLVQGMHCSSCEILIEKELLKLKNIKSAKADIAKGEVSVKYEGERPSVSVLNRLFAKNNYHFFESKIAGSVEKSNWGIVAVISGLLIFIFYCLNRLGITSLVQVTSQSTLPMFFVFGLLAGVSTCAALVGGIVLSLSKQWSEVYAARSSNLEKVQPHLLFNLGRIASFFILGGALGALGGSLKFSPLFSSILVILVSGLMVVMGLQMLGIKYFQRFRLTMPKFVTRYIADEKNFQGRFMPILMGALTFFLPCGFTVTVQGLALLSGSPLQGALIMFAFVLGTTPILLGIGLSSFKLSQNHQSGEIFSKVAGILVIFFGLFNLNAQLNVLGLPSMNDLRFKNTPVAAVKNEEGLPPMVNGKQLIKMNASASGYTPNYFKVRAGVPVRWEITDTGTSGCTNAVISKGLFDGQIALTPGQTSIKEFMPEKPGKYKFSCWMGMISGTIEIIDSNGQNGTANNTPVSSGASGCGCSDGNSL